jgi:uncharacterized membrane protein HdeD (DUF308 family)
MTTQIVTDDLKKRSSWSIFMGVITAAIGAFLIAYPLVTGTIATVVLGWAFIFVGIAYVVFALHSQTIGKFFLQVLLAAIYGLAGIALVFFPISGVMALAVLLGTLFVVYAGAATVLAFQVRPVEGWGWFLFDAAISLATGILILAKWPSDSFLVVGALVGASVLVGGISRIVIAARIRNGAGNVQRFIQDAA